ncbi:MAG TPA: hypothetical protein VHV83_18420, partial [Armatimonadota bacterium]|nr:hypothetical protein [Armatimonadota bacterium]
RRLSGARKDLVVENHVTQAASGIALFAKATGLNVITVNSGELLPKPGNANDSTIINLRHGDKDVHVGLQHGIRIVSGATEGRSAGVVGGETVPRKEGAKVTHYPGEVMEIRLSSAIEKNIADFGIAAVNCDVAHELGHALGAQHHGDAAAPLVERDLGSTYVPPKFTVYGADGVLYTTRPLHVGGAIGTLGNEMSGDTRCIMAYNGVFSWAVHADGGNFTFFNVGITSPGTLFCSSPIGTGINAPNHQPAPLFGNAAADRGNCLGKMTVRDYPAQ